MISAVIFDMDGLLLDSEVYWARARVEFCGALGCDWTEGDELSVKGNNSREWAARIKDRCALDLDLGEIIQDVAERMRSLYHEHLPLLPGALTTVRELAKQYPLGLASSSPPALIAYALGEAGIRECFQVVVSADEVARGKPAPDVYRVAAARLKHPTEQIAVFEDSSAGIMAAVAAGMHVIAVPNPHYPPSAEALRAAEQVLPSLEAFSPETLDRLSSRR